jgi:hypothetical protein
MVGTLQPLDRKFAIADQFGNPTEYFIRWAQQKQIDISEGITADQANELIVEYLAAHQLQEGTGIQITPSGNLTDEPTISADVQEILDQLTATRGTVIYRGLLGWAALLPGTAGHVLSTNGAGADPTWVAQSGGGGGFANRSFTNTLLNASTNTTIPIDNTIPQIGEGIEVLSLTITPTSATARIRVEAEIKYTVSAGLWTVAALFINGAANAVEATGLYNATTGGGYQKFITFEYVPGSTLLQTISARMGIGSGAGTVTFNTPGGQSLGGVSKSSMIAYEVA